MAKGKFNIIWEEIDVSAGGIQNMAYYYAKYMSLYYEVHALSKEIKSEYLLEDVEYCDVKNDRAWRKKSREWLYKHSDKDSINFSLTWWGAWNCYLAKRRYGTPYFFFCHGNEIYFHYNNFLKRGGINTLCYNAKLFVKKQLCKLVMKHANAVFCNSEYTKRLAQKTWNLTDMYVIHPGLPFRNVEYTADDNYSYMLSIARITKQKGLDNVIKVMPDVLEKYPNMKYIIAGEGYYLNELKKLVHELNLEDSVIFEGHISEERKEALLKNCSLFLLPSLELPETAEVEGFGIVYIEANQYGKYVIGNSYGGVSDAIVDGITGKLLKEHTKEELQETIMDFFDKYAYYNANDMVQKRIEWSKQHDYVKIVEEAHEIIERSLDK